MRVCHNCGAPVVIRDDKEGLIHGSHKNPYAYYTCRLNNPNLNKVAQ